MGPCKRCRFFIRHYDDVLLGTCHRYPKYAVFHKDHNCGQFDRRKWLFEKGIATFFNGLATGIIAALIITLIILNH